MTETWKSIKKIKRNGNILEFKGYEVSSLGRVRSYKYKYGSVKPGNERPLLDEPYEIFGRKEKNKGYMLLCLSDVNKKRHNIRIHTVVAQTFLGFPKNDMIICHKNDVKTDNRLENLYYGTSKDNAEDLKRNSKK